MKRLICLTAMCLSVGLLAGCEGEPVSPTLDEPGALRSDSKPVGDPSREPYAPTNVGARIEIPAGDPELPPPPGDPDLPQRNRINP